MTSTIGFLASGSSDPHSRRRAPLPAQQSRAIRIHRQEGKDTVAVEIFSRDAGTLTSEIYQSNGVRTQYTLNLRPDSSVQHVEMTRQGGKARVPALRPLRRHLVTATMSAGGESEKFEFASRGRRRPSRGFVRAREQVMFASHGAWKSEWTRRLGGRRHDDADRHRFHADSVLLALSDIQLKLALSPKGEVSGGRHMSQDWLVERKTLK